MTELTTFVSLRWNVVPYHSSSTSSRIRMTGCLLPACSGKESENLLNCHAKSSVVASGTSRQSAMPLTVLVLAGKLMPLWEIACSLSIGLCLHVVCIWRLTKLIHLQHCTVKLTVVLTLIVPHIIQHYMCLASPSSPVICSLTKQYH